MLGVLSSSHSTYANILLDEKVKKLRGDFVRLKENEKVMTEFFDFFSCDKTRKH